MTLCPTIRNSYHIHTTLLFFGLDAVSGIRCKRSLSLLSHDPFALVTDYTVPFDASFIVSVCLLVASPSKFTFRNSFFLPE